MKKLLPFVLLAFASVAAGESAPKKTDKERIQGVWVVNAVEVDGKEVKGEAIEAFKKGKVTFKGDSYIHSMAPKRVLTFRLDPDKKPAALDLEVSDPAKAVFLFLYDFVDDNTLRLCS